jgi:hypothetical protein
VTAQEVECNARSWFTVGEGVGGGVSGVGRMLSPPVVDGSPACEVIDVARGEGLSEVTGVVDGRLEVGEGEVGLSILPAFLVGGWR